MRCQSFSTIDTDGFRAGTEIGEALRELQPEVILLFASITYRDEFPDLFAGIYAGMEPHRPLIFGGTSDGIYETDRVVHHGVGAMGLNSDGRLRWTTAMEKGVSADSFAAARKCTEGARGGLDGKVDFAIALADGLKADGSRIVAGLSDILKVPFLGGLTGDDRKFARSWVFLNGEAHEDAVAILAGQGPVSYIVNAASGWRLMGDVGKVEQSHGNLLEAMFGSVEPDTTVRVCTATLEDVLHGVDQAMRPVTRETLASFDPAGAVVVSCAGRRWLLADRCSEEVDRVFSVLGKRIPLVGFPSFGEIGPFRNEDGSYTPSFFHNVTFVICLFGA